MSQNRITACIGAGRSGRGIAHAVAYAGHQVHLLDAKARDEAVFATFKQETLGEVRSTLTSLAKLGAFEEGAVAQILARVTVYPLKEASAALSEASIVFEGVPEVLELKKQAFGLFDKFGNEDAILASTTSTILSTDLAKFTNNSERFLNAHWLNPAYLVPLVEVSPTPQTDPDVVDSLKAFLESMGKVPVVCKASPGYLVPRIQALAMNEAARLVEDGVASAEDVDKAIKYGFGLRFSVLGLLEFIDWGGGDILFYASKYMCDAMDSDRFAAPEIIKTNMKEGKIGLRSGSGFFDYDSIDVEQYKLDKLGAFLKVLRDNNLMQPPNLDTGPD